MGDPKKQQRKYISPSHPWRKDRLDEERVLVRDFGLKNKKELWRMEAHLRTFRSQIMRLISASGAQADQERAQLSNKLHRLGLLEENVALEEGLGLTIKDILERRLQTVLFRRGKARSVKQARQFISHNHIILNGKLITAPSYLVTKEEAAAIGFKERSALASEDHPERVAVKEEMPSKEEAELLAKKGKKEETEEKEAPAEESKEEVKEEKAEEEEKKDDEKAE